MRRSGCLIAVLTAAIVGCGGGGGEPAGQDGSLPPLDATDGGAPGDAMDAGDAGTERPGFKLPDPAPPGVTYQGRVVISPAALTFTTVGESAGLSATAYDATGATVTGAVTWTSSRPADVSVDAQGRVTAVTALGSAQITAKIGDRVSAPILVIVVEPQPDSVFVTDAQIVAGPEPVDTMAPMEPDGQTRVSVTGVPALQVGQLLLAKEGKPVAGRVVSITDSGASRAVVLQRIPALDLFKKLKVNATHKVDEAALVEQEAMQQGTPQRAEADPFQTTRSPLMLGPFDCELSVSPTAFGIQPKLRIVPNVNFDYALMKDLNDDWSLISVKLAGQVVATGSATVALMPGFSGTAGCRGVLARVPLPIGGPLAAVVSFGVPLGLKGEIKATVSSTPLLAGLEVTSTGTLDMGFSYTPQTGVVETRDGGITFKMKPKYEGPEADLPFQVKLDGKLGPFAGIDLAIPFLSLLAGAGTYSFLDAGFYAMLGAELAPPTTQFATPTTASKYDIKPVIEIAPGKEAAKALKFFGGLLTLKPVETIEVPDPHAESPKGMMTASPTLASFAEVVEFKIKMDAATLKFIGEDNLEEILIYKQAPGGAPELLETIPARAGQTEFTYKWFPGIADEGTNAFYAAGTTYFAPEIPLEIAPSSKVDVRVARRMNVWSGTVSMMITTGDTRTEMNGNTTTMRTVVENTVVHLTLETDVGPIPEIPGPFKLKGGDVSLSSTETTVTTSRFPNDIGACSYPVTVGTVQDTRTATGLVLDDAAYTGQLGTAAGTGFYSLILGAPRANVTLTSVTSQISSGGGPSCPDTGPPTSTNTFMSTEEIRYSQLTYMGTIDPAMPNVIAGEETIMIDSYPKYSRVTRWTFTKF